MERTFVDLAPRDRSVARVREELQSRFFQNFALYRLQAARLMVAVLREQGIRAELQAGSAHWPRLRPGQEIFGTHFGYRWNARSPEARLALMRGELPEIHAWAGIPATDEIIDLSVGRWPEECLRRGLAWEADLPPDYLWASELPERVYYEPDASAIVVARWLLDNYVEVSGALHLPAVVRHEIRA